MKKLIYLLIIVPIISFAQNETSIISVIIQARDCEIMASFTGLEDRWQDIDSSLKSKFRPPANAPSGTTNVTVGGATARAWYDAIYFMRRTPEMLNGNNNPFTRVDAAARLVGNTWLNAALDADAAAWDASGYTQKRTDGRKRLKRE